MPPTRLNYQNASGTMLRLARSLASHCTKNRAENSDWPTKPSPSHNTDAVDPISRESDLKKCAVKVTKA